MNDREKFVQRWTQDKVNNPANADYDEVVVAEYVLHKIGSQTMEDVEWNDHEHFLAGAEDSNGDEIVMLTPQNDDHIVVAAPGRQSEKWPSSTADINLNGKKYMLVEEPDYPEMLSTFEDYDNAPEGTIVEATFYFQRTFIKSGNLWYSDGVDHTSENMVEMEPTLVLRWGLRR